MANARRWFMFTLVLPDCDPLRIMLDLPQRAEHGHALGRTVALLRTVALELDRLQAAAGQQRADGIDYTLARSSLLDALQGLAPFAYLALHDRPTRTLGPDLFASFADNVPVVFAATCRIVSALYDTSITVASRPSHRN